MTPHVIALATGTAAYEMDDDLDPALVQAVHCGEQIESVEALRDVSGDLLRPGLPELTGWAAHAGTTKETRASTSASGRGGHPGTYDVTGIT